MITSFLNTTRRSKQSRYRDRPSLASRAIGKRNYWKETMRNQNVERVAMDMRLGHVAKIEADLLRLKWMVATTIGLLLLILGKVW
jgi:hypothetical protein